MNAMEHGNDYRRRPAGLDPRAPADRALRVQVTDRGGAASCPSAEAPDLEAKLAGRSGRAAGACS